jgi:hypothetical protein
MLERWIANDRPLSEGHRDTRPRELTGEVQLADLVVERITRNVLRRLTR